MQCRELKQFISLSRWEAYRCSFYCWNLHIHHTLFCIYQLRSQKKRKTTQLAHATSPTQMISAFHQNSFRIFLRFTIIYSCLVKHLTAQLCHIATFSPNHQRSLLLHKLSRKYITFHSNFHKVAPLRSHCISLPVQILPSGQTGWLKIF